MAGRPAYAAVWFAQALARFLPLLEARRGLELAWEEIGS